MFYTNFREALTTNWEAMAMASKGLGLGAGAAATYCAATGCAAANSLFDLTKPNSVNE